MTAELIKTLVLPKAKIKVISGGQSTDPEHAGGIPCLFNPSDFTIERGVSYSEHIIPGRDKPIAQFIHGEAETMQFSLFFDTYSAGVETGKAMLALTANTPGLTKQDVRNYTDPFYQLMDIDSDKHAPKTVCFEWGKIQFEGVVASVSQKFTLFSGTGVPLRAVLTIALKSYKDKNHIRNSPDRTKSRRIVHGDRLYQIAYNEYGDCARWRLIADANGIDNPRQLRSGHNILIPALD